MGSFHELNQMLLQGCGSGEWRGGGREAGRGVVLLVETEGSYVHWQRIHPSVSDCYLLLENIWEIVTKPCSSVPTQYFEMKLVPSINGIVK